jgi:hypothetical protein
MQLELIHLLDLEAKLIMDDIRERESGYPYTRKRIEQFIAALPIAQQATLRKYLLPEVVR